MPLRTDVQNNFLNLFSKILENEPLGKWKCVESFCVKN